MEHADIVRKNNKVSRRMLVFMAFSAIPILFIFALYQDDPHSPLLQEIASFGADWPALMSAKNPLMSKVMDIYCKTAPIFALLFVLPPCNWVTLKTEASLRVLIKTTLLSGSLYFILVYVFLFCNIELTTKRDILKIIAKNDYFLTAFYASIFSGIFLFTITFIWISFALFRETRNRIF